MRVAGTGQPFVTWYDDAAGERTELSYATFGNWVAKTANLLRWDLDVQPGDRVAVDLPPHWTTLAVAFGCWAAGATLDDAAPTRFATAADGRLVVEPDGVDFLVEVPAHADDFPGAAPPPPAPDLGLTAADRLLWVPRPGEPAGPLLDAARAVHAAGAGLVLCRDAASAERHAAAERVTVVRAALPGVAARALDG